MAVEQRGTTTRAALAPVIVPLIAALVLYVVGAYALWPAYLRYRERASYALLPASISGPSQDVISRTFPGLSASVLRIWIPVKEKFRTTRLAQLASRIMDAGLQRLDDFVLKVHGQHFLAGLASSSSSPQYTRRSTPSQGSRRSRTHSTESLSELDIDPDFDFGDEELVAGEIHLDDERECIRPLRNDVQSTLGSFRGTSHMSSNTTSTTPLSLTTHSTTENHTRRLNRDLETGFLDDSTDDDS